MVLLWAALVGPVGAQTGSAEAPTAAPAGVIRLQQPPRSPARTPSEEVPAAPVEEVPYVPGEFERFVQRQAGVEVRRFGAELVVGTADQRVADLSPLVPADYVISPGDEVLVTIWGSVDAELRLPVDRAGRISIPRVGTVQVSGLRYSALAEAVTRRIGEVFKNFQASVSLGQLRGIRVFVTGFVGRPGAYTVNNLSTVLAALLRAGGPAASGSFRSVQLRRGGQLVTTFDLYDLLLKGDRSADAVVQAGDVIHVGEVGPQVGVIGSVNKPTVIELKPGETVADALRMAGGFTAVADRQRLAVQRLQDRTGERIVELTLPGQLGQPLSHGDVVRAFSAIEATLPSQRQSKRVRVEGEVLRPADYVLPQGSTIADALQAAGGLTGNAFLYATEFTRESVRTSQQENYDRALRDLETDLARSSRAIRPTNAEEAAAQNARAANASQLVERLRALKPTGRVVLNLRLESRSLPDLLLEDGDRLLVPPLPTTVGVFGSVFNASSYLFVPNRALKDYLRLAGGPTKGADEDSVFVIRANGEVVSNRQNSGWFQREASIGDLAAQPGDTIFVPEEVNKTTFLQAAKDWTQILYQFGLGAAGIKSAVR